MAKVMRKIALDLGTKSCGFAISDPISNSFAIPLENFFFEENNFKKVINKLKHYEKKYEFDTIILGYPLRMTGTRSERSIMVEEFEKLLRKTFSQRIVLVDERLSTVKAKAMLKETNISQSKIKEKKDSMAAALFLNYYLNNFLGVR